MTDISSFSNFSALQFSDDTGNAIDMVVDIAGTGTALPFTATANDSMDYGRQIYTAALNGTYGPVADYVPPVTESVILP
jgi:short-subunit dehydrogenase